jgi:ectoine hydroxylase-related dioxygenase (phytanoyl-CoA dioxygenase family)
LGSPYRTFKGDPAWRSRALEAVRRDGFCVIENVLDDAFLEATRAAMYRVQGAIERDVGKERLARAGELGVLRLMLKYDPHFLRFLEVPELLAAVDDNVSATAIMHLQNGFILPSFSSGTGTPDVFQNSYHRDFPRHLNGYVASVNVFFAIDEFRADNGATYFVPGTHQQAEIPAPEHCRDRAVPATCPAGSMIVFDSTLWHAAGRNVSGRDRLAINHQFTRSYIKQQVDYVRSLDDKQIRAMPPRTQQLLGYYTRVVTSLDEYYRLEGERLYRKAQG